MSSNIPRRLRRRQVPFANFAKSGNNYESETGIMEYRIEENMAKEQAQFAYLDKLEEDMDLALKMNCSRADEWISRLENELERPDYCEEAKRRINWLLYRVMDGEYEMPDDFYAEQEEISGIISGLKDAI